jgi:hypothetical protein
MLFIGNTRRIGRGLCCALLACPLLGGCTTLTNTPAASPTPALEPDPPPPVFTTKIASMPLGLVVELNNEYLGMTPLEIVLPGTSNGKWEGKSWDYYTMRCSTPDNQTWEIKRWRGGDRIPTRVLFRPPGAQQRMAVGQ